MPEPPAPRDFLNDLMRRIDALVVERVNRKVQDALGTTRLGAAHGRLMAELRPGIKAIELAQRLGITKPSVGQLLDRLEAEGMISRSPDPSDGRAQLIYPTERAGQAYAVAREALMEVENEWRQTLGSEPLQGLRQSLEILDRWRKEHSD
jgi:DNA-binding MarR family transcriptional regulator